MKKKCWVFVVLVSCVHLSVCAVESNQAVSNALEDSGIVDYRFFTDYEGYETLQISDPNFSNLKIICDAKINGLDISNTKVSDLTPIAGMKLEKLNIAFCDISDLSPLSGMPLKWLDIDFNKQIADISFLANMPLTFLRMSSTSVNDISALHSTKLKLLIADGSPFYDLSPLRGLPLTDLLIEYTGVKDLFPILELPLERVQFTESTVTNGLSELCAVETLHAINGVGADDFWDMRRMDELGDAYYSSYVVPADTPLATKTQKAIDDMQQLVSTLIRPACVKNPFEKWMATDPAENLATNLLAFGEVAHYLKLKVVHADISKSKADMDGAILVTSNNVITIDSGLLKQPTCVTDSSWFNVNDYLKGLPLLKLADGYVLDYVYWTTLGGGAPHLYGRKKDAPRISSPYLMMFLTEKSDVEQIAYVPYLSALTTDDSIEGYIQLAVFNHLCEQFYLSWHGGYRNAPLIASYRGMQRFLSNPDNVMRSKQQKKYGLPIAIQDEARRIDPSPRVRILDNAVLVSLVAFSDWEGFFRQTLVFSRTSPHQILSNEKENLVKYNCGIMF